MGKALERKFRNSANGSTIDYGASDLYDSTKIEPDVPTAGSGMSSGAARAAQSVASGGSKLDAASAGLVASGNPYAVAAGAGLSVLSASKKREQANKELQQKAKLERISRQSVALNNFSRVTDSLRSL